MKKVIDTKRRLFENMIKLNSDFKINEQKSVKEMLNEEEEKWIQDETYGVPAPLGKSMAKQINEDDVPVKYRAEVTGVRENKWSSNAMEYDTEEEAKDWLRGLATRWFGYDMSRVVPTTVPKGQPVDMENDVLFQNFRR